MTENNRWFDFARWVLSGLMLFCLVPDSGVSRERPPVGRQQSPPSPGSSYADSLLVIGTAYNAATSQFRQPGGFGNARLGSLFDPAGALRSTADAERAMEQALKSSSAATDLRLQADVGYFQLNNAEYFAPATLKIAGTQLAGSEYAKRIFLDVIGEVNGGGAVIQNFREAVDVRLSDKEATELPMRQIAYDTGFTLFPGKYSIKFVVYDWNSGRVGTYQTALVIPNLSKEVQDLPISSVVLSNELVTLEDALPNSMQARSFPADAQLAMDPLVIEGKKLIPAVTHEFNKRRDLIVFLHAYEPNATTTEPLTAFVTLYRGQTKVLETPPRTFRDDLDRTLRTLPVQLRVPLTNVPPGAYDCQITVVDSATHKSAQWRSQITVVN